MLSFQEVTKSSSQDRLLQSTRNQILEVPVPQMMEYLVDVPKIVSQDRIRQRTFEQLADIPSSRFSPRTSFIDSPVDQILDVPVPQMTEQLREKCQRWCLKADRRRASFEGGG